MQVVGELIIKHLTHRHLRLKFAECTIIGDDTIDERLALFESQTENVKCQIAELKRYLNLLEYKLAFYQKAKALGPVEAVNLPQIPETT